MSRKLILITLLLFTVLGWAGEVEDFRFAIGLYRDGNYALAKTQLSSFITDYPSSTYNKDATYLLANSCLMQQDYEKANLLFIKLLSDMSVADNLKPEINLGQAQTEFFLNDYTNAKKHFKSFSSSYKNHKLKWKADYYLGRIAFEERRFEEALKYLDNAEKVSSDADMKITRMKVYLNLKRDNEAKIILNKIIETEKLNEKQSGALVYYLSEMLKQENYNEVLLTGKDKITPKSAFKEIVGIANYETGNYNLALSELGKLKSERARYYTGLCLVEDGQEEQAKEVFSNLMNGAENEEVKANSMFYLGRMESDPGRAISLLQQYRNHSTRNELMAAADFQIGLNQFKLENYNQAKTSLNKALSYESDLTLGAVALDTKSRTKAEFLLAEIIFVQGREEEAFNAFSSYLKKYPNSDFSDEVIYKRGLYFFQKEDWADARKNFLDIVNNYQSSSKLGMSHYYVGTINLLQSRLSTALTHFESALVKRSDIGLTLQKLALVNYKLKNYGKSLSYLNQVPDEYRYLLQNYLMLGKVYFAQKNYELALESFDQAARYQKTAADKENVLNLKAWTYYQMNKFEEASSIYEQLSGSAGADFTLKAATSAFSAEDYFKAIDLYKRYLQNSPNGKRKDSAQLGIADSFYNLGDYASALEKYRALVKDDSKPEILENAVNGMRWCSEQLPEVNYTEQLERQISIARKKELKHSLLNLKMKYELEEEDWASGLSTSQRLISMGGSKEQNRQVRLAMAYCQKRLKKYEEAEATYQLLADTRADSELLIQWADLYLMSEDYPKARVKLTEATRLTRNPDVWLSLLEADFATNHDDFERHYNEFKNYASEKDMAKADLMWIEWKVNNQNIEAAEAKMNLLSSNGEKEIMANVQYLKGYILYKKGIYDQATPELLRVRYLYPEFPNLKNKAESVACLSYISAGKREEAVQLYDLIRDDIPAEYKQQIESQLGGE